LLLEKYHDIQVVGDADEAEAAAKLARALSVDVVVLNVTLVARGADLVRAMLRARSGVRVVVVLSHPSVTAVRDIVDAGAAACLTKECATDELVTAIRTVMSGRQYVSPSVGNIVVNSYVRSNTRNSGPRELAPREREILRRIADGQTTKEIAVALRIGVKTVETHRRRLMEKLNRHSVAELTKYARRAHFAGSSRVTDRHAARVDAAAHRGAANASASSPDHRVPTCIC
jgi:DNA-binding NarL/FixJ family response regulator